eukprot:15460889-Alexandrium_andersonii.AAC.1
MSGRHRRTVSSGGCSLTTCWSPSRCAPRSKLHSRTCGRTPASDWARCANLCSTSSAMQSGPSSSR